MNHVFPPLRQYALYFLQNDNLLDLWPPESTIKVEKGRAFFHFNHKLCLEKINDMLKRVNITAVETTDIGPKTNGDKVPCEWRIREVSSVWRRS